MGQTRLRCHVWLMVLESMMLREYQRVSRFSRSLPIMFCDDIMCQKPKLNVSARRPPKIRMDGGRSDVVGYANQRANLRTYESVS